MLSARKFSTCCARFSGHNKWSKIKGQKRVADAQKNVLNTTFKKLLTSAVRCGGSGDPEKNATLFAVIKRAKAEGVPKENIQNAIAKATNKSKAQGDQILTYEALAHGIGIIIECATDNPNRTGSNVKAILNKHKARLAPVKFMFDRKGHVLVTLSQSEDRAARLENLVEAGLSANADDFEEVEDSEEIEFTCPPSNLAELTSALTAESDGVLSSEVAYTPIEEAQELHEETDKVLRELVDDLENLDDATGVWTSLAD